MKCTYSPACSDVATMRERHGTPAEFTAAVWAAFDQGFATSEETNAAIEAYRRAWDAGTCATGDRGGETR